VKELKNYIIQIVANDAVIQGITGWTADDPRVYEWFPGVDPAFNSTYPAYLIYRVIGHGRGLEFVDRAEPGDLFFHFDILAMDSEKTSDIAEQLETLLDLYGPFETFSYKVGNVIRTENFEMPTEGESSSDRMLRYHVAFQLRGVLKKTAIGNVQ
jgi:hypothetical protein